jgi:hypothetical protein
MSATNGVSFVTLCQVQESEVTLQGTTDCNPSHSFADVQAGWLYSEETRGIVWYLMVGAVADNAIDHSVPCSATVVVGGSFPDGSSDPFGGLVGHRSQSVAMSVLHFIVQSQVVDEVLASVTAAE